MAALTVAPLATVAPYVLPTIAPLTTMAPPTVPAAIAGVLTALPTLAPGATQVVTDAVKDAITVANETLSNTTGTKKSETADMDSGLIPKRVRPFVIPIIALIAGAGIMQHPPANMYGKLVLYFGAQSFMNIFMSQVLGSMPVLQAGQMVNGKVLEHDLKGCPAGFVITALQQLVSFALFMIYFGAVYNTKWRYAPKVLATTYEWVSVICFGVVFALNIALNNFSLGYISIGVNLILRSCLPLSTYMSQQFLANFGMYTKKPFKIVEVTLMMIGVLCACLYTWADMEGHFTFGAKFVGVLACVASVLCGSLNLALAGVLGETKLNVLDTVAYMSIPAALTLVPIIFLFNKPLPEAWLVLGPRMTDWQILQFTWAHNRTTVAWLAFSGVLSFAYNIVQITIVHTLSPSATAFGGNFNKAALTFLTLFLPFLQTTAPPPMPYYAYQWLALAVNIYAFSHYSYLQIKAKQEAAGGHKEMEEEDSSYSGTSDEEAGE